MSHFYASAKGTRLKEVTRCGDKRNGIQTHTRGWTLGVRVVGTNYSDGVDAFAIYATQGSSQDKSETYIGYIQNGVFMLYAGVKNPLGRKIKL